MTSSTLSVRKFIDLVRRSFDSEHGDFTKGDMREAVILLSIPMILELSLESVFAVVDMFFVSGLGANAIATVGLTEAVVTIVYSIAIGLSTASTAIIARRTGEKNIEGASHAAAQALILALVSTVFISAAGLYWAADILAFMGASNEVIAEGLPFTRVMLGSSSVIIFLFLINGIFRGAGDAAMAMKSLWLASLINIILCPVFIHFFGLVGAAVATVIGRGAGVAYQCYHLFFGKGTIKFKFHHFKLDPAVVKSLISVGWPATIQFIVASGSWIILAKLVAETGGTNASAGYQIAIRNVVFFILPAWGLSNAAATLVGQNLGAGNPDRAAASVFLAARYNTYFMTLVTVLFVFFSRPIIHVFTSDPQIAEYGVQTLRIIGSAYIFYGIGMVMMQALNGAGDTRTPTLINIFCFWIFQVPLAYALSSVFNFGVTGVLVAIPVAEMLIAVVAYTFFKRGKWKTVRV